MKRFMAGRSRALAVGAAAALTGGALLVGVASAQTPTPTPTPGQPGQGQSQSGQRLTPEQRRTELAARLAQALGQPQAQVEAALQQTGFPPAKPERPADATRLAPAATQLGVTAQQLTDALQAARQQFAQNHPAPGTGQAQPGQRQRPDMTALYTAVAQTLSQATGRTITAEAVQTALEAGRDQARQTMTANRDAMRAEMDARLQGLATALGVTVDELKTALKESGGLGRHGHGPGRPGGPMRPGGTN